MSSGVAPPAMDERFFPGAALHGRVAYFDDREADMLDNNRFSDWLDLLHPDITYEMPIRTTEFLNEGDGFQASDFFKENYSSMKTRIDRLATNFAWAETPPSRTRHVVTNVLIDSEGDEGTLAVRSNLLLNRTRADGGNQTLTASRRDELVPDTDRLYLLRKRRVLIDQTVVSATNLSLFF